MVEIMNLRFIIDFSFFRQFFWGATAEIANLNVLVAVFRPHDPNSPSI